jgi:hypothetical protein
MPKFCRVVQRKFENCARHGLYEGKQTTDFTDSTDGKDRSLSSIRVIRAIRAIRGPSSVDRFVTRSTEIMDRNIDVGYILGLDG